MSTEKEQILESKRNFKDLENVIAKAIKKVRATKENELCKYLPMTSGGYMHHFTLKKMKYKNPEELSDLLKEFIIETEKPRAVAPKQRAARGSRKRKDQITFTRGQLEKMLNMARLAGDTEIVSVLSPKKSLAAYKRELIQSVRHNKVNQDLWNGYAESVNAHQMLNAQLESMLNN